MQPLSILALVLSSLTALASAKVPTGADYGMTDNDFWYNMLVACQDTFGGIWDQCYGFQCYGLGDSCCTPRNSDLYCGRYGKCTQDANGKWSNGCCPEGIGEGLTTCLIYDQKTNATVTGSEAFPAWRTGKTATASAARKTGSAATSTAFAAPGMTAAPVLLLAGVAALAGML